MADSSRRLALESTVSVVTGGSRGIGLAIARAFVSGGARVVITGRNQEHLDRAAAISPAIHAVRADVCRSEEAARAIEAAAQMFGGIDVLVNNAGVGKFGNVADMSVEEWRDVIETNLTGVFFCTRAAIPALKKSGGGWIINIASLAGRNYFPGGAAYCASKAGLIAFTESVMQEVRYDNIRVSVVMPGSVATEFSGPSSSGEDSWKLSPDDVAEVVMDLVRHPARSLPSKVEIRPSKPKK